jgi:hypothetical protein
MVARFVFQRNHFSTKNKRIKPAAFLPPDGATSVFKISGLTEEEIWACGELAGERRGVAPYVRGDLFISQIRETELDVVIDNNPQNHGNIVNWPPTKDERLAKAQQLSNMVANFAVRLN